MKNKTKEKPVYSFRRWREEQDRLEMMEQMRRVNEGMSDAYFFAFVILIFGLPFLFRQLLY